MNFKLKTSILIIISILLLAACSKKESKEIEAVPDETPEEMPVEKVFHSVPFTGELTEDENTLRPVLATLNNHPLARPQSGISDADIIYEFIAEGNVTRLLALFQSELPNEIGPIRSARDYFVEVAKGLDAFYVAHGYSPDARSLLESDYVDHVNGIQYDGTLFKRSSDRKAPHNSYISNESILSAEESSNSPMEINKMPSLSFHESIEDAKIGESASSMAIRNGSHPNFTSTYMYNEDHGTYERMVNDIVTIDKANNKQVELSNVLVFEARHETIDAEGRQLIDLESGGKALLFQAGIVKEIEWENIDGILTPTEEGISAKLVPGKTWIHIIRTNPGMDSDVTYTP